MYNPNLLSGPFREEGAFLFDRVAKSISLPQTTDKPTAAFQTGLDILIFSKSARKTDLFFVYRLG